MILLKVFLAYKHILFKLYPFENIGAVNHELIDGLIPNVVYSLSLTKFADALNQ